MTPGPVLTGPTAEVQGQLSDLLYEQMALNEQIRSLREQLANTPPPVVNLTTPDRAVEVITSTPDLSGLEAMLGALLEAFQRDPGNGAIAEALQALRKDLDAQSERMIHASARPGVYGGGGTITGPILAQDKYRTGQTLADQTGAGAVLTFAFDSSVQLVWVLATGGSGAPGARVDPFGGTPAAAVGIPSPDSTPIPISVETTTVKVFAPSGVNVSVWGFRY